MSTHEVGTRTRCKRRLDVAEIPTRRELAPVTRRLFRSLVLSTTALLLTAAPLSAQGGREGSAVPKAVPLRVENYLLLPEPKATRSSISFEMGGARLTVFSPMRQEPGSTRLIPYTESEFNKLGISRDSFATKAAEAADRKLAQLQPELIKNAQGQVIYAVYRGPDPVYSCLLLAPSLGRIFEKVFGKEVWVVTPDRHSLYVFPAGQAAMEEFAADLEERFLATPFAASEEIFSLKADGNEMRVVGNFTSR